MRVHRLGVRGLTLALLTVTSVHCGSVSGPSGGGGGAPDASPLDNAPIDSASHNDAGDDAGGKGPTDGGADSGAAIRVGSGNDHCNAATPIPLDARNPRLDLHASTATATHEVDVPCSTEQGADTFYRFAVSKRVFIYADTFGATWNTVLFLLSDSCTPLTTTMAGGAVCNDDGCATQQSRIVARLEPGAYRLGLAGVGAAKGAATIHFEWALAGSGTATQLPDVDSVQVGATTGSQGNIDGLSPDCLAAASENSYWWARCPSDPARTLKASTCGGGTTWESVLETQIPRLAPALSHAYACNLDACGLQASVSAAIPAGAGLGVLSIDGQSGGDVGAYTMTVTYAP